MKLERTLRFKKPGEHLEWALKSAYKYAADDEEDPVTQSEATERLCDALCNLIGDDAFCEWLDS